MAARWALRTVLGDYLGEEPSQVALRVGERGKPSLAGSRGALRFNLSHSEDLAVVVVGLEREVGVDIQCLGARPAAFYSTWTRREALAKCAGSGLGTPLPVLPLAVADFDAGAGFAASVAVEGKRVPSLSHFELTPAATRPQ